MAMSVPFFHSPLHLNAGTVATSKHRENIGMMKDHTAQSDVMCWNQTCTAWKHLGDGCVRIRHVPLGIN